MDYSYYLCDAETGEKDLIVDFMENARFKEARNNELVFVAKGGGDCGGYSFPYLLRYDVENKKLSREELYLTRSVAFGASGAWEHVFKGVSLKDGAFAMELAVAPGQVLAGGHKRPGPLPGLCKHAGPVRQKAQEAFLWLLPRPH